MRGLVEMYLSSVNLSVPQRVQISAVGIELRNREVVQDSSSGYRDVKVTFSKYLEKISDKESFGEVATRLHDMKVAREEKISKLRDQIFVLKQNMNSISPETAIIIIEHIQYLASQLQMEIGSLNALQLEIRRLSSMPSEIERRQLILNPDPARPTDLKDHFQSVPKFVDSTSIAKELSSFNDQEAQYIHPANDEVRLLALNLTIAKDREQRKEYVHSVIHQ